MTGFALLFAVGGPVVTAVGAFLLAYDVVRGPVAWYGREFFGARAWELLRQDHERNLKILRGLPVPPYTPEAIQRLVEDSEAQFKEMEWKGKERLRDSEISSLHHSQRLAFMGLVLVALGSLAQSVAVVLNLP